jgi:AhpD family alkylhydroperoxidase
MLCQVPDRARVMFHNPPVLKAVFALGRQADKRWDACDENLKSLAHMAVSALVGCSFCLDLGYFMAHNSGLDETKTSEVPRWRESDVFTELERDVMEYAESMSQTPPTVTDELAARMLDALGPAAMVELASWIGFANLVTGSNVAMGIESQGFPSVCSLPLAEPSVSAGLA